MAVWWRDVIREATFQGYHTPVVQLGLRYGMALFIASEVMFFAAFFWAFFASSLFPVGGVWPPKTIHPFNPFEFPFLNTLILLLSGTTVTWAHHSLIEGDRNGLLRGLALTVFLGICFTSVQAYEYSHAPFHFTGGIYPSTFFMATGFHGFHVIIGTTLPDRLPLPGVGGALQARPSLRLRGGRLVLAFCRRRLAVPVRLCLLLGGGERRRRSSRLIWR